MNRPVWIGLRTRVLAFIGLHPVNAAPGGEAHAPGFNEKGELLPPATIATECISPRGRICAATTGGAGPAGKSDDPFPLATFSCSRRHTESSSAPGRGSTKPCSSSRYAPPGPGCPPTRAATCRATRSACRRVKQLKRFRGKERGYFNLMSDSKSTPWKTISPDQCWSCHNKNGAVDNSIVQFYPPLKRLRKKRERTKGLGSEDSKANSGMNRAGASTHRYDGW